jgi:phosphatidylglycerophosphate synthase
VQAVPVTAVIAQVLLIAGLAETVGRSGAGLSLAGWAVGVACALTTNAALALALSHYRADRLRPADWITLTRATLAVGVAALVADSFSRHVPVTPLVSLAAVALALDAVDGWVARRTRTTATMGERFDGEVDALLILILSVYVARSVGAWVLAIGAARYVFLAAGWQLPSMRAELPPRFWRKTVAAVQGVVLTVAAAHILSAAVNRMLLALALAVLAESFGRDVWWLWRHGQPHRHRLGHGTLVTAVTDADTAPPDATTAPTSAVATPDRIDAERDSGPAPPDPESGPAPSTGPRWPRARRRIGPALTIVAVVVVWAALVSPDQPSDVSLSGFARIPLEGLALVALASVLPVIPRRILAGIVGPLLAVVVVFKVLDIGFLDTFNRRFDLLSDKSYVGSGIETLRASIGRTEANVAIVGIVVGTVALVIVTTYSAFRLTRVAAAHRGWALRAVAGLGAVWALLWAFGAQFITHTPIASTLSAGVVVNEVRAVQAGIKDQIVFADEIKRDTLRNTPASQVLTKLRGKDVLLVFIEAYGQQAVEGRSFSPEVDAALSSADTELASAGFSARSGFLDSATYGGISWLAHSTLQSGLWVNSQRRYNDLVSTNRFTLSDAFNKAGWRTIADVPSDDYFWPEGTSFYHYDKTYDRRDVGYHGPTFAYASMPDQYTYAALDRLELSKTNRKPLFAEVDTVSSHEPWSRIPVQIPWSQVGDGSVYNRPGMDQGPSSFDAYWSNSRRVQAAYGRSIVYSLNTLFSFVKHAKDKNLVMIVLGDHQPLPIVSGHQSNHDVPISIIAHDPSVLKQIGSWGWNPGLQPKSSAPVWPMSAFRNNFLNAFDSHPANR